MSYKNKYLKYKNKYLSLIGGSNNRLGFNNSNEMINTGNVKQFDVIKIKNIAAEPKRDDIRNVLARFENAIVIIDDFDQDYGSFKLSKINDIDKYDRNFTFVFNKRDFYMIGIEIEKIDVMIQLNHNVLYNEKLKVNDRIKIVDFTGENHYYEQTKEIINFDFIIIETSPTILKLKKIQNNTIYNFDTKIPLFIKCIKINVSANQLGFNIFKDMINTANVKQFDIIKIHDVDFKGVRDTQNEIIFGYKNSSVIIYDIDEYSHRFTFLKINYDQNDRYHLHDLRIDDFSMLRFDIEKIGKAIILSNSTLSSNKLKVNDKIKIIDFDGEQSIKDKRNDLVQLEFIIKEMSDTKLKIQKVESDITFEFNNNKNFTIISIKINDESNNILIDKIKVLEDKIKTLELKLNNHYHNISTGLMQNITTHN
jgi:hypothetical protein